MINQEVKGTLAKLLATENLTVEHRQVTTAYFDVENRVLCLPIWKSASNTVYDLLVGHEVGHALYTPADDWDKSVPKAFINVLEDARIEKLMKRTYPGLRKSFFDGYKELWDQDFFGVKHEDHENLSLIDRINLYFKGNLNIPFSDEEKTWVDRTGKTETFQEVVDLAKDLYGWAKEKQAENEQEDIETEIEIGNGDGNMSGGDSPTEMDVKEKDYSEEETSAPEIDPNQPWDSSENPLEDLSEGLNNYSEPIGGDGSDLFNDFDQVDETESITDKALQESLEDLVDDDAKEWVYLGLPKVEIDKLLVSHSTIQSDLEGFFSFYDSIDEDREQYKRECLQYADDHYNKFKKDAQKSVNYLVKQFEMKKSADEYKRAAVSKTGVINTNTLYKYKLTDDIFKKVTTVPEGKNHGLILHLDWSGSMQYQLLDTVKQVFNLVWFCRKAGIPFRVYAFQSSYYGYDHGNSKQWNPGVDPKEGDLAIADDFRLLELLSSKQNAKSLENSLRQIYRQVFAIGGYRMSAMPKYTLGGTPLAEAVFCTRQLVKDLKKVENVQKVNVVCLTDGEANPMSYWTKNPYMCMEERHENFRIAQMCHARNRVFILRDSDTGYQRKLNGSPYETTKEIVSYMREITDYNWIGIRLCSKGEVSRLVRMLGMDIQRQDELDKQWKKERFASIKDEVGFSQSFYMPDRGNGEGTQDLTVKQKGEVATKAELQRAFKKHMGSKTTNKTLLNAFIEQIA